jgi:hypothetical protein
MTTEMSNAPFDLEALGYGAVPAATFETVVATCLGTETASVLTVEVTPVGYPIGTVATESLDRVHGWALDAAGVRRAFRIFVKQLHSAALWPHLDVLPPPLRGHFVETFPWRIELDAFQGPLAGVLPEGMRLPALYAITEPEEGRATIWMEDVEPAAAGWDDDRFTRAAHALGRLAARRPADSPTLLGGMALYRTPGMGLRMLAEGQIRNVALPEIADRAVWERAPLADVLVDRRQDIPDRLLAASGRIDDMLDRLDRLPQALAHGDACPQNLLVPADEPDTFVAIDWGFNTPQAVGFDLGQLLLGLLHDNRLSTDVIRQLEPLVVAAYTDGLRREGHPGTADQVHEGYALSAMVRSGFTALGFAQDSAGWTADQVANRMALTEHLLELSERYA